jgi:hypothetical protein
MNTGGIDVSQARQCAERLRALQTAGVRLTGSQRHVLEACERRVRRAEAPAVAMPRESLGVAA